MVSEGDLHASFRISAAGVKEATIYTGSSAFLVSAVPPHVFFVNRFTLGSDNSQAFSVSVLA